MKYNKPQLRNGEVVTPLGTFSESIKEKKKKEWKQRDITIIIVLIIIIGGILDFLLM